jgi:predicted pyridoxine 5'-phosphate oxidase superfamily flavin-nucleotide-binding protein
VSATPALPELPPGLVGFLATADGAGRPYVIPVSAIHRAGPRLLLIALAHRRGSLARLRARPEVALSLAGPGFALSAEGPARVAADPLPGAEFMVAVALQVERLADHLRPETELRAGVSWGWREPAAAERDARVLRALAALAAGHGS